MRDVDDAHAFGLELSDLAEEQLDLAVGQRGRRLIERQYPATPRQCGGDLDHLLLSDAQTPDGDIGSDLNQTDAFHNFRRRMVKLSVVNKSEPARQLLDKNVLRDAEGRDQIQLLHYDLNAMRLGVCLAARLIFPLVQIHLARIGALQTGRNGYQCAFARAVFANEGVNLPLSQVEVNGRKGLHAGK